MTRPFPRGYNKATGDARNYPKEGEKMKVLDIRLSTIQDVRDFVNCVTACDFDVDLASGRYIVDAKSIMGIFSLDLLNPIRMTVHSDDAEDFLRKVEKFVEK